MRRQLISSLLTCRIATAFMVLGNSYFLYNYGNNNNNKKGISSCRDLFLNHRRNVALCSKQQQQQDTTIATNPQEKANNKNIDPENIRTRQTPCDLYFRRYGWLPLPKQSHRTLSVDDDEFLLDDHDTRQGILVIGDVHGCFEELLLLHEAAVKRNDGKDFCLVILVGDLCNKGPYSAKVIRHVRMQPNWLAVRGNHDNAALGAALGNEYRRQHPKYDWVKEGEDNNNNDDDKIVLSDKDVMWMSDLPYTITIPASLLNDPSGVDTVIVHAGLLPGVAIEDQDVPNMIHLREVVEVYNTDPNKKKEERRVYAPYRSSKREPNTEGDPHPLPWAASWKGPFRVIFGHDAKRGFQRYGGGDWAIGLDTGAVYGQELTGIVLPQRRIVSVDAVAVHVPVKTKETDEEEITKE